MSQYTDTARTIIQQINAGGPVFPAITAMIGAKKFTALSEKSIIDNGDFIRGGVMFPVAYMKGNVRGVKIIIELTVMDTYNVVIGRQRGIDWTVLERHDDIYCDGLGVLIADLCGIG
jgi:hypothetical protein